MYERKNSSLGSLVLGLALLCSPLILNAQVFDWDDPTNGSGFLDDDEVGGGGVSTSGTANNIFDLSDEYDVDISWSAIGAFESTTTYGGGVASWQDPTAGGAATGAFGGNGLDSYIVVGWDNNLDDNDGADITFTFNEPLFGIEFSVYDIDEDEDADPTPGPWDDVVQITGVNAASATVNLGSEPGSSISFGPCVEISNEGASPFTGIAYEGLGDGSSGGASEDSDSGNDCTTDGVNTVGGSSNGNLDVSVSSFAVSSVTVAYRSGNDIGNTETADVNPAAQRIGITDISWPMINGHIYEDITGDGVQQAGEPDLANVDVFLCSSPVASSPCDPSDPEYLRPVTTDANGDWVGNTTAGDVVASIDTSTLPAGLDSANPTEGTVTSTSTATVGQNDFSENDGFTSIVTTCPAPETQLFDFDTDPDIGTATLLSTQVITDEYAPDLIISGDDGGPIPLTIYNSSLTGGADTDLERSNTGNVLIKQEEGALDGVVGGLNGDFANNPGYEPNDKVGGTTILQFSRPLVEFSATLVDWENPNATLTFTDTKGTASTADDETATVTHGQLNSTSVAEPEFGQDPIDPGNPAQSQPDTPPGVCETLGNFKNCNMTNSITAAELGLDRFDRVEYTLISSGGIDNLQVTYDCNLGIIGDRIFEDLDLGGTYTPGEGLDGVTVSLTPSATVDIGGGIGQPITTVTSIDGFYIFDELPAGEYTVAVVSGVPGGLSNSVDPDGGADSTADLTLTQDESNLDQDFGYTSGGQNIGDLIFYDFDGNGVFDGADTGISGVEVELCFDSSLAASADNFGAVSYGNNDGTVNWAANWDEINDDDLATIGAEGIYIAGGQLQLDGDSGGDPSIQRALDLTDVVGNVELTFDFNFDGPQNDYESNDEVDVFILNSPLVAAGAPVGATIVASDTSTLDADGFPLSGTSSGSFTLSFVSPGTTVYVAFVMRQFNGDGEILQIDNLSVDSTDPVVETCQTTTTNASGFYTFFNQPANDYTITVDPNGTTLPLSNIDPVATADPEADGDGISAFTFAAAGDDLTRDFGYQPNAISGNVSEDINGDAAGEVNLAGVTVQLYADAGGGVPGALIGTTTTDASGNYVFNSTSAGIGIPEGDYVVVQIDQAGYSSVNDGDSTPDAGGDAANASILDSLIPVTVAAGEIDENNDFVDAQTASLEGTVWLDEDLDGINDIEEAGITDVIVELYDGGVLVDSITTDANGNYSFDNLYPGTYEVRVTDGAGTPLETLSNTAGPGGLEPKTGIVVNAGDMIRDIDFGYIPRNDLGAIGDRVWADANDNGIQDPGEAGIENVVLRLLDNTGTQVGSTVTTNANGDYLFTDVPLGDDYTVEITGSTIDSGTLLVSGGTLDGYTATTGPQSEGGIVSRPTSLTSALRVVTDLDFGFDIDTLNTLIDTVWFDEDGDGVQDAGEAGIPGVTVDILNAADEVIGTAVTDANGEVTFTGLPNGSYRLRVTDNGDDLAGLTGTTDEGVARLSDPVVFAAPGAETDSQDSFGYNNPGLISGTVYNDQATTNSDQDPGEAGFEDITITLWQDADNNGSYETVVTTTTTDSGGFYAFDGLPPGDYQVQVTTVLTPLESATRTEDPDGGGDDQTNVTLGVGQSSVENDFGYSGAAGIYTLSGTVFLDPDKDGIEDAGEPGIPGVTLDLIDRDSIETYNIIGGAVDYNQDGVISAADNGTVDGVDLINGQFDVDDSGTISAADDGTVGPYTIVDGVVSGAPNLAAPSDGVVATITTDNNGDYTFSGLVPGDYSVAVSDEGGQLAGYDLTSGLDVLDETIVASNITDVDFGYIKEEATGSIAGEVFIDENSNGTAEDAETDLPAVDVYLCSSPIVPGTDAPCDPTDDEFISSTTTDSNGEYIFNDLPPGEYVVGVDPADIPTGLTETVTPPAVSLSEGEDVTDVDVGHEPVPGSGVLAGFVWTDVDGDGVYDPGEAPIPGVLIEVRDSTSATPALPNGPLVGFATTQADGSWIISGIDAVGDFPNGIPVLQDQFLVGYTSPANIALLDGLGLASGQPTNLPLGDIEYFPVDLDSDPDRSISNLDFGFQPLVATDFGSISGTIYSDLDPDPANLGSYSEPIDGELAGVSINLVQGGVIIATVLTDENGFYEFSGLPDGDYNVIVTDTANVTKDLNTNEVISNPITIDVSTPATRDITDQNAGYVSDVELNSIGNKFFFDTNGDGNLDEGEPGIPGITIQCWLDNDLSETPEDPTVDAVNAQPDPGIDNLIRTVVTDENGEYYCTSLPAGQYIVVVQDSLGYSTADAVPDTGLTADGEAKNWAYTLTLADDEANYTADFAVAGSNEVNGYVRVEDESLDEPLLGTPGDLATDLDGTPGDGDPFDPLFPGQGTSPDTAAVGVPVQLLVLQDGEYVVFSTTITDADGFYEFTNLPDGDYVVEVVPDGSSISGFGQTGDPSLTPGGNGNEDLVCDSPTDSLCDNRSTDGAIVLSGPNDVESGVNFMYQRDFTTTPVTMSYFKATRNGGSVEFKWETANEVGNAGFQIYARGAESWELISTLIVSANTDSYATNTYYYDVSGVDAEWFSLVAVSTQEEVTPHGPFKVGEEYGAHIEAPAAFDWSGIDRKHSSSDEVSNSVKQRLQRAMREDPEAFQ